MRLEDQVFADIIKALGAVPAPEQELRRRGASRFHVDREITIRPFGVANAASRSVTLVDLSVMGLCIIDRLTISSGDQFIAYLPMPSGGTLNVLCTARQSRLSSTGAFRVGAEFTSEMERDTRFVRGVSGVVAASKSASRGMSGTEGDMQQPAIMRFSEAGGKEVKVSVRGFRNGVFDIASPQPATTGDQFILELHFIQQRVQQWRCTVTQTRAAEQGTYLISARNEGPVHIPPQNTGIRGWWRRHFGD